MQPPFKMKPLNQVLKSLVHVYKCIEPRKYVDTEEGRGPGTQGPWPQGPWVPGPRVPGPLGPGSQTLTLRRHLYTFTFIHNLELLSYLVYYVSLLILCCCWCTCVCVCVCGGVFTHDVVVCVYTLISTAKVIWP